MILIKRFIALLVLLSLLLGGWVLYFAITPLNHESDSIELLIKPGSMRSVSQQLVEQGVLSNQWLFEAMVRALGKASQVKTGNYLVKADTTPLALMTMLTNGDVTLASITFIEGWTFAQMRAALNANNDIRHMTMAYTDQEILADIGATEVVAEGLFFPDTYFFSRSSSDREILKRAYQTMQTKLQAAWMKRAPNLPYDTAYKALIMASIVEKETGKAIERPQIAGVFLNRLRMGMRLQTDPTVIYGLGINYDGNLRKRDLLMDTPYNTYTRAGLPPTPIAMPSLAAIEAALHPAATRAIYFVGKGDGSHVFSSTLAEHNRAVVKYQLRRQ